MMRRCSVMRMPRAAHWASMSVDLGALTTRLRGLPNIMAGGVKSTCFQRLNEDRSSESKVAPQDERRGALALPIVTLAAADLAKSGAAIEPQRRLVALLHLEEHRAHAHS